MVATAVIYHNPKCSKSRETLELLRSRGLEPRIVEYLKEPPDRRTLTDLLGLLGLSPRQLLRAKEAAEVGLDAPSLSDDDLIAGMCANPRTIERPIVVITSNNEKELPDAFLRRCFFHYIKFPDRETMQAIIDVHFPGIQKTLVRKAMDIFYEVRDVPGLKKKPSTSELLDWLKLLLNEDMPLDVLQNRDPTKAIPPLHGALLKNEQDIMLFERLAFMARRPGN